VRVLLLTRARIGRRQSPAAATAEPGSFRVGFVRAGSTCKCGTRTRRRVGRRRPYAGNVFLRRPSSSSNEMSLAGGGPKSVTRPDAGTPRNHPAGAPSPFRRARRTGRASLPVRRRVLPDGRHVPHAGRIRTSTRPPGAAYASDAAGRDVVTTC